ncbi:MAG: VOC family protein, partial [Candidatus Obscuribacterales bacterium]|nr:VOC family protein [Steroidobacteraceae bacterium]
MNNALTWFEIPALDLDRAAAFYGQVIGQQLSREQMGPTEMAVFPFDRQAGIGGCLQT